MTCWSVGPALYWTASLRRTNTLSLVLVSISAFSCSTWRLTRPATRSTNGVLYCRPGPATRTNFPKRSTIARSCCSTVKKKRGTAAPPLKDRKMALGSQPRPLSRSSDNCRPVPSPAMATEPTPEELIGLAADEQLLAEEAQLPEAVGHPQPIPATRGRGAIVAAGAAMTGLALIGGVVVLAIALIDAFANGASLLDGGLVAL